MHIIFISYHPKTQVTCWHVLPKVSQAAKILSPQANLKPTCRCKPKFGSQNCHDIPPATWSQLQTRKIRQSETRNVDSFTPCESWVFCAGKAPVLCLNTWNLAISFWSITKLEFIILFDQSVFWPNLAWRIIFQRKRKERRGTGKDGGKD